MCLVSILMYRFEQSLRGSFIQRTPLSVSIGSVYCILLQCFGCFPYAAASSPQTVIWLLPEVATTVCARSKQGVEQSFPKPILHRLVFVLDTWLEQYVIEQYSERITQISNYSYGVLIVVRCNKIKQFNKYYEYCKRFFSAFQVKQIFLVTNFTPFLEFL